VRTSLASAWLGLAAVPILGSAITEPAAMTIAASMLAPQALLKRGFSDETIGAGGLLLGALFRTLVAVAAFALL
jgi:hypothetical protein